MDAYICAVNHLERDFVSISCDDAAANVDQLIYWDNSRRFITDADETSTSITITTNQEISRDTFICWDINLLNSDVVEVRENDGGLFMCDYVEDGQSTRHLAMAMNESRLEDDYLITVRPDIARQVAFRHIWMGNRIGIPNGLHVGFKDPRSAVDVEPLGLTSRTGVFIGGYVKPTVLKTQIKLSFLDDDFMENSWPELRDHLIAGNPFYVIPDFSNPAPVYESTNDVFLCWVTSPVIPRWSHGDCREIILNVSCLLR
jgi:hypothetical protein